MVTEINWVRNSFIQMRQELRLVDALNLIFLQALTLQKIGSMVTIRSLWLYELSTRDEMCF